MSDKKTIYAKIAKVMSQVERVPKNGYNNFHKYEYATESDLTEAIRPILQEAGLAFFSTVIEQERDGEFTKAKMEFTLADVETGETITRKYWGEGQAKGDKGLYKAYTGAVKSFLMKTFLIPTGDDPEQDEKPQQSQKEVSMATLKAKWQTLAGDLNGFDDWHKAQKDKGVTNNQMNVMLTKKLKEKQKEGKAS